MSIIQANIANNRTSIHNGHKSQRILSNNHDEVGISGEFAFGEFCGLMPDTKKKPTGDNGIDFNIKLIFSVDVKTFRKPNNLIHEKDKPFADIFVLAKYDDDTGKVELIGWEWGTKLKNAPYRDFGYGVINHYIPASSLRSMDELKKRLSI